LTTVYSAHTEKEREREFILYNHKCLITKQLLDNTEEWPEGYNIPINAGHTL